MEKWKMIKGYEGLYSVSTFGRVRNERTGYITRGSDSGHGYKKHLLFKDGCKPQKRYIHRLVAEAFIDNPEDLGEVNHIDGDRANNDVSNLEWVSSSGNTEHAVRTGALIPWNRRRKPIIATDVHTGETMYFDSISKAEQHFGTKHIDLVLKGKRNTAKGHTFRYAGGGGGSYVITGSIDIQEA